MRKQRNHSFPKTYTTAGAVYRAKKNFQQRFPDVMFFIVHQPDGKYVLDTLNQNQDGKYVLDSVTETQTQEIV